MNKPPFSLLPTYRSHQDSRMWSCILGRTLTEKILQNSRFVTPVFEDADKHVYHISWEDFVYIMEGVIRLNKHEYFDEVNEEEFDDEDVYEDENGDDFGESEFYSV